MSLEEEAIAKAQMKGGAGVADRQKSGTIFLNERIVIYLGGIAFIGLCVVWATAESPWILYGSFALLILMVILWGVARIKRIERIKQERAEQARASQSAGSNQSGSTTSDS